MKTWHKRGLAWVLTATMLTGNVPVSAFAEENGLAAGMILEEASGETAAAEIVGEGKTGEEIIAAEEMADIPAGESDVLQETVLIEDLIVDEDPQPGDGFSDAAESGDTGKIPETDGMAASEDGTEEETGTEQEQGMAELSVEEELLLFEEEAGEDMLELAAEEGSLEGDTGEDSTGIRVYWPEGLLRGDDGNTWMYTNEQYTMQAAVEGLAEGQNYAVDWQVSVWNEELNEGAGGEDTEAVRGCYEVNDDGSLTINGSLLWESGNERIDVGARAILTDSETSEVIEIGEASASVELRTPVYNYDLPGCGPQLPGWWFNVEKYRNCWVEDGQHPHGENVRTEITDLTLDVDGENSASADAVALETWEDGNGWILRMNNYGHAVATVTYLLADGSENTDGYTFDIWVGGNVYNIGVDSDTDTNLLLPGNSLNLNARVWLDCYDEERGHYAGDVSDVTVEWTCTEGADAVMIAEDEINDKTLNITAAEGTNGRDVKIEARAFVPDPESESGKCEVACTEYRINISDNYYKIARIPVGVTAVGESIAINPQLYCYDISDKQKGELVDVGMIRYRWEWDDHAVRITDGNGDELFHEEASDEYTYGAPAFALTKLKNWNTDVTLIAELNMAGEGGEENWQEVARRSWNLQEYNYGIWFEELRGGDHTWVFEEEDLTLGINTERMEGLAEGTWTVEWQVGPWDEKLQDGNGDINTEGSEGYYYNPTEDSSKITLHGENIRSVNGVNVRAIIMAGGEEVSRTDTFAGARDSRYEYDYPCQDPGSNEILPGDGIWISADMGCYAEDKDNPWGRYSIAVITDIAVKSFRWNEETQDWETTEDTVVRVEPEENGWNIVGENYGRAVLTLTHTSAKDGEEEKTYDLEIYVNGDTYDLVRYYPNDTDCMLVNSTMNIGTALFHNWHYGDDRGGEEIGDYYLELQTDDEGEPCYDRNLVTAEVLEDGKTLQVTSNDETYGTHIPVRIWVRELDENGQARYYEAGVRTFWVNVTREYHYLLPTELQDENGERINVKLGGALDIAEWGLAVYRNQEGAEGPVQEPKEEIRYRLENWDTNAWEIQERTETEEVPILVRKGPWSTSVTVVAEKNYAETEGEEDWQEVARRDYWFDELDTTPYFRLAYGDEENGGRIFAEAPQTITIDTERLDEAFAAGYDEIVWTINCGGEAEEYVTAEESGDRNSILKLTANGEHLYEWINVYAAVTLDGEEVGGQGMDFLLVQEEAWYNLPDSEYWMLKDWDLGLNRYTNCGVQNVYHPYGEEMGLTITDVRLEVDEGAPECIELSEWEDGNGWNIHVHNQGHANVFVDYVREDGTGGTYEFAVCVGGEIYNMNLSSSTGYDQILPGNSLDLTAEVVGYGYNEEIGHYDADLTGLKIEWIYDEENDPITITANEDGSTAGITVNADAEECDIRIEAIAFLPDESEESGYREITRSDFWLYVRSGYCQLAGVSVDEEGTGVLVPLSMSGRMGIRSTLEFEPVLWWFDSREAVSGSRMEDVRYRWEWDPNAVRITYPEVQGAEEETQEDNGTAQVQTESELNWTELTQNADGSADSVTASVFRLERIGDWGTHLKVIAEIPDDRGEYQEAASFEWGLEDLNYDVWFDNLRDEGSTWVFEDEEYKLQLNTDNLQGLEAAVEWTVYTEDEEGNPVDLPMTVVNEESAEETTYYAVDEEENTITLYGVSLTQMEALWERGFRVKVNVYSDSEKTDLRECEEIRVGLSRNEDWLEDDETESMLVETQFYYADSKIQYWVKDQDHPWGEEYTLNIKSIIAQNCTSEEENGAVSEEPVYVPVYDEDTNSWYITANREGSAEITFTLEDPKKELGENGIVTVKRIKSVLTEKYRLYLGTDKGSDWLLPGESLQLISELWRGVFSEESETGHDYTQEKDYSLRYSDYDDTLISVESDGVITALDTEGGDTSIRLTAVIGENDTVVAERWFDIHVSPDYHLLTTESVVAAVGDMIQADHVARLMHFSRECPEGYELDHVEYFFGDAWDDILTVSEDGKSAAVNEDGVDKENPVRYTGLDILAVYTDPYGYREFHNGYLSMTVCYRPDFTSEDAAVRKLTLPGEGEASEKIVVWSSSDQEISAGSREDLFTVSISGENAGYYRICRDSESVLQIWNEEGQLLYNADHLSSAADTIGFLEAGTYYIRLASDVPGADEEEVSLSIWIEKPETIELGDVISGTRNAEDVDTYLVYLPYDGHFAFLMPHEGDLNLFVEELEGGFEDGNSMGDVSGYFSAGAYLIRVGNAEGDDTPAESYQLTVKKDLLGVEIRPGSSYVLYDENNTKNCPEITVTDEQGNVLAENVDYVFDFCRFDSSTDQWKSTDDLTSVGEVVVRIHEVDDAVNSSSYVGWPQEVNQAAYRIMKEEDCFPKITVKKGTEILMADVSLTEQLSDWTFQLICEADAEGGTSPETVHLEENCEHGNRITIRQVLRVSGEGTEETLQDVTGECEILTAGSYRIIFCYEPLNERFVEWTSEMFEITVSNKGSVPEEEIPERTLPESGDANLETVWSSADENIVAGRRADLYRIAPADGSYHILNRNRFSMLQILDEEGNVIYNQDAEWGYSDIVYLDTSACYMRLISDAELSGEGEDPIFMLLEIHRPEELRVGETIVRERNSEYQVDSFIVYLPYDGHFCFLLEHEDVPQKLYMKVTELEGDFRAATYYGDISDILSAGAYLVQVGVSGDGTYSTAKTYSLGVKKDLLAAEIALSRTTFRYVEGEDKHPVITVTNPEDMDAGNRAAILTEGLDYVPEFFRCNEKNRELESTEDLTSPGMVYIQIHEAGNKESAYVGWPGETNQVFYQIVVCDNHISKEGSEKLIREANCSQTGIMEYTCVNCEETYQIETAKLPDKHNYSVSIINPTCTANGSKTYTCKDCGYSYTVTNGTALGHTGGSATCTKLAVCSRCGKSYGSLKSHTAGSWTVTNAASCETAGTKVQKCTVCGTVLQTKGIPATGHKWSTWTTTAQATVFAAEQQKRICSVCGKSETRAAGSKLAAVLEVPGKLTSLSILKGKTVKFALTMANGDSVVSVVSKDSKCVKVASYDKKKGTVSLKAVKTGSTKITVKLSSGKSRTYAVKVSTGAVKTTKISGVNTKTTLQKGKTLTLKPVLTPFTSTQKVTYQSSDKKVATVTSSGKIKAVAPGTATITVTSGSKKVKCKVTVPGISNVKTSVSVKKNKTLTLNPKVYGISGKVTYTSSNPKVAVVDTMGKVKGIKKGTATITVQAGTYTVKCKVKVQ